MAVHFEGRWSIWDKKKKKIMVIHNSGKYKITTHMYKLKFNSEMDVKSMAEVDFPRQLYMFKPFAEIQALDDIKDGELFGKFNMH